MNGKLINIFQKQRTGRKNRISHDQKQSRRKQPLHHLPENRQIESAKISAYPGNQNGQDSVQYTPLYPKSCTHLKQHKPVHADESQPCNDKDIGYHCVKQNIKQHLFPMPCYLPIFTAAD